MSVPDITADVHVATVALNRPEDMEKRSPVFHGR